MQLTNEQERKLDAPAGFRLPELGGPLEPRLFTSVCFDVPGGSLAGAGITLRCRTERGEVVRRAKTLQDELGSQQDPVVAEAGLRTLTAEASPAEALAAGRLIDRERMPRAEARAAWHAAWERLEQAGS